MQENLFVLTKNLCAKLAAMVFVESGLEDLVKGSIASHFLNIIFPT